MMSSSSSAQGQAHEPVPSSASPFAIWFDAPEHADVLLNICNEAVEPGAKKAKTGRGSRKGGSTKAAAAPTGRSVHCHAIVLSTHSAYFKAQLSSMWQQPRGTGDAGSTASDAWATRTVDVHVEAGEVDAMYELLRLMYRQALPAAATPRGPLLLQCLALAERFEAASCIELLVTALAAAPTEDIHHPTLAAVFQASPAVRSSHSYTALVEACCAALVRLFGDVPAVVTDQELMQQFVSLPHAAVLAWAKQDQLKVHSENCVVFLVSAWVEANQDCPAAQLEQLANQVRVFHLGPTYQHHILPNLPWFKDLSSSAHLPAVLSCIRGGVTMKEGPAAEKTVAAGLVCPPQWMARPRQRSDSSRTISWAMTCSQLNEVDGGKAVYSPTPLYINGFLMQLQVQQVAAAPSASTPGKTMGVYHGVDLSSLSQRGLPCPDHAMLPMVPVHVKVGSRGSRMSKEGSLCAASVQALKSFWGLPDVLGAAAPTFLELVRPYLEEGQLHIEAIFNAVDTAR